MWLHAPQWCDWQYEQKATTKSWNEAAVCHRQQRPGAGQSLPDAGHGGEVAAGHRGRAAAAQSDEGEAREAVLDLLPGAVLFTICTDFSCLMCFKVLYFSQFAPIFHVPQGAVFFTSLRLFSMCLKVLYFSWVCAYFPCASRCCIFHSFRLFSMCFKVLYFSQFVFIFLFFNDPTHVVSANTAKVKEQRGRWCIRFRPAAVVLDSVISVHLSCSGSNEIIHRSNLQKIWFIKSMMHFKTKSCVWSCYFDLLVLLIGQNTFWGPLKLFTQFEEAHSIHCIYMHLFIVSFAWSHVWGRVESLQILIKTHKRLKMNAF